MGFEFQAGDPEWQARDFGGVLGAEGARWLLTNATSFSRGMREFVTEQCWAAVSSLETEEWC